MCKGEFWDELLIVVDLNSPSRLIDEEERLAVKEREETLQIREGDGPSIFQLDLILLAAAIHVLLQDETARHN